MTRACFQNSFIILVTWPRLYPKVSLQPFCIILILIVFFPIVVYHAISLLVSWAYTDSRVSKGLLHQKNFRSWLKQLVLLAREVCLLSPRHWGFWLQSLESELESVAESESEVAYDEVKSKKQCQNQGQKHIRRVTFCLASAYTYEWFPPAFSHA